MKLAVAALATLIVATQAILTGTSTARSDSFNIAYSGLLELRLSQAGDVGTNSHDCPLQSSASTSLTVRLGLASGSLTIANFQTSSFVLNGTELTLDLRSEQFRFVGSIPLTFTSASATGRFQFEGKRHDVQCIARVELQPRMPSDKIQSQPNLAAPPSDIVSQPKKNLDIWSGNVVGDGGRVEYGWLFCKETDPQQITMNVVGADFHGQIRRNRDGLSVPFDGTIVEDRFEGKYSGPDSEIKLVLTATYKGGRIVGRFFSPSLSACHANFELRPHS